MKWLRDDVVASVDTALPVGLFPPAGTLFGGHANNAKGALALSI
jgi:hypothetical protein